MIIYINIDRIHDGVFWVTDDIEDFKDEWEWSDMEQLIRIDTKELSWLIIEEPEQIT